MRLLLLSFYYPPDLSAGSFRAQALVAALRRVGVANLDIHLVTTMPNRYHGFAPDAPARETFDSLRIDRVRLPAHESGMRDQAIAFAAFARGAYRAISGYEFDGVFATSSRLMTAALAASIARRRNLPLYLDIRDLFTDTMGDLLADSPFRHVLPLFRAVERVTFRSAQTINMVSPGFHDHVAAIAGKARLRCFTNGVDDGFINSDWAKPNGRTEGERLIVYAGNIGEGQGLETVIPAAARALAGRARFRIIGGGGRLSALRTALGMTPDNVELLPPVDRETLYAHYREADMLFLHLNDHPAFTKVLPSKMFEYAATGKRILAGLAGESARFVVREIPGAELFAPCDVAAMIEAFNRLDRASPFVPRADFVVRFARTRIMDEMARDLLEAPPPANKR